MRCSSRDTHVGDRFMSYSIQIPMFICTLIHGEVHRSDASMRPYWLDRSRRRPRWRPPLQVREHRGPTDDGLHACDLEVRATEPHSYADDPADRTQDHRLEKELAEDRLLAGTDRLSNAYLTGSLGHRDQHDVHDSDTTHEKRVGTPGETPQVERLWQYI